MGLPIVQLLFASAVLIGALNASVFPNVADREPSYKEFAKMARFIVHRLDWTAMATISSNPAIIGYPMVGVISYADSAIGEKSTGQIYMMLTDLDIPEKDLKVQNKLALLFSAAQYKNCSDPMEPTCSRVMMTGQMVRMEPGTEEYDFGLNAMLSRHPVAAAWDMQHNFYLAKVDIQYIMIQDFYGAPNNVPVDEYFAVDLELYTPRKNYRRPGRRNYFARRSNVPLTPY